MTTQPTINELFGSDSEDEEEQIDAQVSTKMSCMFGQMLQSTYLHIDLRDLFPSTKPCISLPCCLP